MPDEGGKILGILVFGQVARFQCFPDYSQDGVPNSSAITYEVSCHSNGNLLNPADEYPCINNNECLSLFNRCEEGGNGNCTDNALPTKDVKNNFRCDCASCRAD